jgi:hypothetical protein
MRPPNYRPSGGDKHGMLMEASCVNCRYSRQVGELGTVCTSYFALVLLTRVCDSWDGDEIKMLDPQDPTITIRYIHDPSVTLEEWKMVDATALLDTRSAEDNECGRGAFLS